MTPKIPCCLLASFLHNLAEYTSWAPSEWNVPSFCTVSFHNEPLGLHLHLTYPARRERAGTAAWEGVLTSIFWISVLSWNLQINFTSLSLFHRHMFGGVRHFREKLPHVHDAALRVSKARTYVTSRVHLVLWKAGQNRTLYWMFSSSSMSEWMHAVLPDSSHSALLVGSDPVHNRMATYFTTLIKAFRGFYAHHLEMPSVIFGVV